MLFRISCLGINYEEFGPIYVKKKKIFIHNKCIYVMNICIMSWLRICVYMSSSIDETWFNIIVKLMLLGYAA